MAQITKHELRILLEGQGLIDLMFLKFTLPGGIKASLLDEIMKASPAQLSEALLVVMGWDFEVNEENHE